VIADEVALCMSSLQSCAEIVARLATNATLSKAVEMNSGKVHYTLFAQVILYALQSVHICIGDSDCSALQ